MPFGGGCGQQFGHFVVADLVEVGEHLTDCFKPGGIVRTPHRRLPRRAGCTLMPAPPAPRPRSVPDWPPGSPAPRRACWHRWRFRHRRESPSCLPHPRAGGRRGRRAHDGEFGGLAVDRGLQLLVADSEAATTLSLMTMPPPLASAPIASSCHCGTPSLRTRNTSSGAPSAGGDLPSDRYAAAGQPENHQVVPAAVGREFLSQDSARFAAVPERASRVSPCEPAPSGHRSRFAIGGTPSLRPLSLFHSPDE